MKQFKFLPLSLAVAATLATIPSFAADVDVEDLQRRLQELETKLSATTQADDQFVDNKQPLVISPDTIFSNNGIEFSGYARYGAHYNATEGADKYVGAIGQTGNAAGRLGNEGNGGEFQFLKGFDGANGTKWDVAVMLEHWGGDVDLKKFYASATNIFESQPQLEIWAGRDFHQRPQADLNDHYWSMHDGQGAGFYNLNLGSTVMLDAAVVAQVGSDKMGDSENYAFTSKLKGIDMGVGGLSFIFNYGFGDGDKEIDGAMNAGKQTDADWDKYVALNPNRWGDPTTPEAIEAKDKARKAFFKDQASYKKTIDKSDSAYQVGASFDFASDIGSNQVVITYVDGGYNNVFLRDEDVSSFYAHLEGSLNLTDKFGLKYLTAYNDIDNDDSMSVGTTDGSRENFNVIVRPTYQWNNIHSTWLEGGYSNVNYDDAGTNDAWKVTLSQNISIGGSNGERPMLRFYATYGEYNNDVTKTLNKQDNDDTFAVGAMWEAWW
jgi:maltoporin